MEYSPKPSHSIIINWAACSYSIDGADFEMEILEESHQMLENAHTFGMKEL